MAGVRSTAATQTYTGSFEVKSTFGHDARKARCLLLVLSLELVGAGSFPSGAVPGREGML